MAKFIQGNELNFTVESIFRNAESVLMIISPYIKLHHRFQDVLKEKLTNDKLQIIVVFGKNESDITKSISSEELDFFKKFPNIELRHEKRLHAKYYANEFSSLLTSMNLYDFSQDKNIEAGIFMESSFLQKMTNMDTIDNQSFNYFDSVVENSLLLFKKEPQYEKGTLGIGKKYSQSIVTVNNISNVIKEKVQHTKFVHQTSEGHCIRCNKEIKLNSQSPFCPDCYKSWNIYKNKDYTEQFCHVCGVENKTSFNKPTCFSCYRKQKK